MAAWRFVCMYSKETGHSLAVLKYFLVNFKKKKLIFMCVQFLDNIRLQIMCSCSYAIISVLCFCTLFQFCSTCFMKLLIYNVYE